MKGCPSTQRLEQFLDEQLDDTRHRAVAQHIGSCATCQATLERLTQDIDPVEGPLSSLRRPMVFQWGS